MSDLGRVPLQALVELARLGTVAAVAQRLGYTPGAVSQQLARLEAVVGSPVTTRFGRGVRLTDAGRILAEHAVDVLQAQDAALAAARSAAQEVHGRLTVGVFGSTAGALLAPLVLQLGRTHPGITVTSREVGVDATASAVQRGEVDVAFGVDYPLAPMPRQVDTELLRLRTEDFALAVPPGWATGTRVPLHRAAAWPWILTPASTPFGSAIRNACRAAGFEPQVSHEVTDSAASLLLAASGLGVTPVTPLMRRLVDVPVTVVELEDPPRRHLTLLHHRADAARPLVQVTTTTMRAVAAELTRRSDRQA